MLGNAGTFKRYGIYSAIGLVGCLLGYKLIVKPLYKRHHRAKLQHLKTMVEEKINSQWVVICGPVGDIVESYIAELQKGRLRIAIITNEEDPSPPVTVPHDASFGIKNLDAIKEFFSYRHIKLVINCLSLPDHIISLIGLSVVTE